MANQHRENWGSRLGFILAVAGSAIGLGNVWKFPYITGMNGGGAFVLIYLICIFFCGLPLMLCEFAIGRHTRKNPVAAFQALELRRSGMSRFLGFLIAAIAVIQLCLGNYGLCVTLLVLAGVVFRFGFAAVGAIALLTALLILSYYSVIGGWIIEYTWKAFSGHLGYTDVESAGNAFNAFILTPSRVVGWHFLFLALSAAMLWGGIRKGIERWSKILMPLLFFLLLAVIVRSVTLPGAHEGIAFFLTPDFSKLSAAGALEALGHSFYTLSLGMAISITYGSYLSKNENTFASAFWVIIVDTMAAMLAGLAIFPAVFAMGFAPGAGPSLIFKVLPATFNSMPGGLGWLWAGLFFLMLTIAAISSAASLLECGVTFLIDQCKMKRARAIVLLYVVIGTLGILSAVSIADWKSIEPLHQVLGFAFGAENLPGNWFDALDRLTSNWMIPLIGLLTALFVGWVWTTRKAGRELRQGAREMCDNNLVTYLSGFNGEPLYRVSRNHGLTVMTLWGLLVRYWAPVIILVVFLKAIGVNIGF